MSERGPAEHAVRVGESFNEFKMVVAVAGNEGHRLAGEPERGCEVTTLPLEFRRVQRRVGNDYGRSEAIEVTLWAQRLFYGVVELHIRAARRKPGAF